MKRISQLFTALVVLALAYLVVQQARTSEQQLASTQSINQAITDLSKRVEILDQRIQRIEALNAANRLEKAGGACIARSRAALTRSARYEAVAGAVLQAEQAKRAFLTLESIERLEEAAPILTTLAQSVRNAARDPSNMRSILSSGVQSAAATELDRARSVATALDRAWGNAQGCAAMAMTEGFEEAIRWEAAGLLISAVLEQIRVKYGVTPRARGTTADSGEVPASLRRFQSSVAEAIVASPELLAAEAWKRVADWISARLGSARFPESPSESSNEAAEEYVRRVLGESGVSRLPGMERVGVESLTDLIRAERGAWDAQLSLDPVLLTALRNPSDLVIRPILDKSTYLQRREMAERVRATVGTRVLCDPSPHLDSALQKLKDSTPAILSLIAEDIGSESRLIDAASSVVAIRHLIARITTSREPGAELVAANPFLVLDRLELLDVRSRLTKRIEAAELEQSQAVGELALLSATDLDGARHLLAFVDRALNTSKENLAHLIWTRGPPSVRNAGHVYSDSQPEVLREIEAYEAGILHPVLRAQVRTVLSRELASVRTRAETAASSSVSSLEQETQRAQAMNGRVESVIRLLGASSYIFQPVAIDLTGDGTNYKSADESDLWIRQLGRRSPLVRGRRNAGVPNESSLFEPSAEASSMSDEVGAIVAICIAVVGRDATRLRAELKTALAKTSATSVDMAFQQADAIRAIGRSADSARQAHTPDASTLVLERLSRSKLVDSFIQHADESKLRALADAWAEGSANWRLGLALGGSFGRSATFGPPRLGERLEHFETQRRQEAARQAQVARMREYEHPREYSRPRPRK